MEAAGLLQAWVTPDGVYASGRDGSDVIWTTSGIGSPGPGSRSLSAVLRPADDAGTLAGVVNELLRSVGYGDDLAAEGTAISAAGRWRHRRAHRHSGTAAGRRAPARRRGTGGRPGPPYRGP